jgi:NSS family neurotransmitter:Na+ symporter
VFVLGVPVTVDLIVLDLLDGLANGVLLVLGSLLLAGFVGWVIPTDALDELTAGTGGLGPLGDAWIWAVRVPVAVVIVVSLLLGVLDYVGFLTNDFSAWMASR